MPNNDYLLAIWRNAELGSASDLPAESESAKGTPVKLKDKAIKDKAESTRVENGTVDKGQIGNDIVEKDRVDPTETRKAKGQRRSKSTKTIDPTKMGRMISHRRNPTQGTRHPTRLLMTVQTILINRKR